VADSVKVQRRHREAAATYALESLLPGHTIAQRWIETGTVPDGFHAPDRLAALLAETEAAAVRRAAERVEAVTTTLSPAHPQERTTLADVEGICAGLKAACAAACRAEGDER
jgi:hypothetical protein